MIVAAQTLDAKKLTEIALQSKAYWGYSAVQIESWKEELMVIPKMFQHSVIHKYLIDTEIAGFYILENTQPHSASLAFLFVAPQFIKQGIGKQLVVHVIEYSRKNNYTFLKVLSDPNAAGFYKKYGFKVISQKQSSIAGRFLPAMELRLS
jgi:ribosomal protein S18 acetylase RimI-like enzyme|tara:strand:+ start:2063 stop:2512 length:450 start_codon:yes stop_codon:yes gene_type:complete